MSFVNKTTMALVGVDQTAAHRWMFIQLAELEKAKQLKACTPFAAWWTKGDDIALPYADAAGWAFEVAIFDPDIDSLAWVEYYAGPDAVEDILWTAFETVEKVPYGTEGEFVAALHDAAAKVAAAKRGDLVLEASAMVECKAKETNANNLYTNDYRWMTKVTYGALGSLTQGAKNAAWLERSTTERRGLKEWNRPLDTLLTVCQSEKRANDTTSEFDCAYAVMSWLDSFVCIGPEFRVYHDPARGRDYNVSEEARFAHTATDGKSAFVQTRTVPLVAVKTHVVKVVTRGANGPRALNAYLLDIAAVLLSDQVAVPERIFTSSGVQQLERAAHYGVPYLRGWFRPSMILADDT